MQHRVFFLAVILLAAVPAYSQATRCENGALAPGEGEDLEVVGLCTVGAGTYRYRNVNIYGQGSLEFLDEHIEFWVQSMLIENNGRVTAGTPAQPIGSNGGSITIRLYGSDAGTSGAGILCKTDERCGVDEETWHSHGAAKVALPGGMSDYFYPYEPLAFDGGDPRGYFGYKVLAVSYGGTLQLYGSKGSTYGPVHESSSGSSWARLDGSVASGATTLRIDRLVDWQPGDQIVVTTTDYLPAHSEQVTISSIQPEGSGTLIETTEPLRYPHNGARFDLNKLPAGIGPAPLPGATERYAETRAAVALLSRSIRIVSAGEKLDEDFPAEATGYYFGGYTVVRQGVRSLHLQGVEFHQLGQGGRIGHYPVHFHMARRVPADTVIADCSIHDSNTRWVTLHSTQGVTLQRKVGYKSIGHGFYLEDGTETDNRFISNIGILARAAVDNAQNPRRIPGILAKEFPPFSQPQENVPYHTDIDHPSVFWITNGWNEFVYNMAAGAGSCGACYWLVPASNSTMAGHQKWEGYAGMQSSPSRAAMTPLKRFEGNYCTSAMNSFHTIGNTTACSGVTNDPNPEAPQLRAIPNPYPVDDPEMFWPKVDPGGGRFATLCAEGEDCSTVPKCSSGSTERCAVMVLDRYTTSFNWAETNFSAVWLRPQWYLMVNSVISDVQNGGLTFVTGGGYTKADVVEGHWALVSQTAFIGASQNPVDNPYASSTGPINPGTPLTCATQTGSGAPVGNYCLLPDEGVSLPMSNFGVNQRLFNIYDGPAYQESNAYLSIPAHKFEDCSPKRDPGTCDTSRYLYARMMAVPKDAHGNCYQPNAAIGWKQPNGFYYPPAFHSSNLFFDQVDIRHYVIQPRFAANGLYLTDPAETAARYCTWNPAMFSGFTDVDRQTELSDDDGSLTGLVNTVSVNQDTFFHAPVQTAQCASDVQANVPPGTATTSPYEYVTTALIPECGYACIDWAQDCAGPNCYGVPLYRQYQLPGETNRAQIRMAGQSTAQRSSLTVNNGRYYIDTTVSAAEQRAAGAGLLNVFQAGQTYYTMLLFAGPTTRQTYQMYVGPDFDVATGVFLARGNLDGAPVRFRRDGTWPSTWPAPQYDAATGLLTVTIDMSFPEFQAEAESTKQRKCGPASFCSWKPDTSSCGSSLDPADSLHAISESVCRVWPVKDIDCPEGGCYAFGVTLTPGFTTGSKPGLPPPPIPFPTDPAWTQPFVPASQTTAGTQCHYPSPPVQ